MRWHDLFVPLRVGNDLTFGEPSSVRTYASCVDASLRIFAEEEGNAMGWDGEAASSGCENFSHDMMPHEIICGAPSFRARTCRISAPLCESYEIQTGCGAPPLSVRTCRPSPPFSVSVMRYRGSEPDGNVPHDIVPPMSMSIVYCNTSLCVSPSMIFIFYCPYTEIYRRIP